MPNPRHALLATTAAVVTLALALTALLARSSPSLACMSRRSGAEPGEAADPQVHVQSASTTDTVLSCSLPPSRAEPRGRVPEGREGGTEEALAPPACLASTPPCLVPSLSRVRSRGGGCPEGAGGER